MLLRLSLVFTDRAPSRFLVAWRSGSSRQLAGWLRTAQQQGRDDDATRAATRVLSLAAALSAHDRRTRGHSERVRAFTDLLAEELGIPDEERGRLRWAGLLHDIGKLEVLPRVLNKSASPDHEEWAAIRRHPSVGATLAGPLLDWLGDYACTIEQHHERVDGSGYPRGLRGDEICVGARVVAVADCYDCMVSFRPYRPPLSPAEARAELARGAGAQFDADVVRAFLNISLGRLRWVIGPVAWLAQIPVASRAAALLEGSRRGSRAMGRAGAAVAALSAAVVLPVAHPGGLIPAAGGLSNAPARAARVEAFEVSDVMATTATAGASGPIAAPAATPPAPPAAVSRASLPAVVPVPPSPAATETVAPEAGAPSTGAPRSHWAHAYGHTKDRDLNGMADKAELPGQRGHGHDD